MHEQKGQVRRYACLKNFKPYLLRQNAQHNVYTRLYSYLNTADWSRHTIAFHMLCSRGPALLNPASECVQAHDMSEAGDLHIFSV